MNDNTDKLKDFLLQHEEKLHVPKEEYNAICSKIEQQQDLRSYISKTFAPLLMVLSLAVFYLVGPVSNKARLTESEDSNFIKLYDYEVIDSGDLNYLSYYDEL